MSEQPEGTKYLFRNTGAGRGELCFESGEILWRYAPPPSPWNFLNGPLRGPDFVLADADGHEQLRIERERSFPLSRFAIVSGERRLGSMEVMSVLSTSCALELGGQRWLFKIPPLSAQFIARSSEAAMVSVHMRSQTTWFVFVEKAIDGAGLLGALAFVQSERCRW